MLALSSHFYLPLSSQNLSPMNIREKNVVAIFFIWSEINSYQIHELSSGQKEMRNNQQYLMVAFHGVTERSIHSFFGIFTINFSQLKRVFVMPLGYPFGPICTPFGPHWTTFGPIWIIGPIGPIWTIWTHLDPSWTHLDPLAPFGTH